MLHQLNVTGYFFLNLTQHLTIWTLHFSFSTCRTSSRRSGPPIWRDNICPGRCMRTYVLLELFFWGAQLIELEIVPESQLFLFVLVLKRRLLPFFYRTSLRSNVYALLTVLHLQQGSFILNLLVDDLKASRRTFKVGLLKRRAFIKVSRRLRISVRTLQIIQ